MVMKPSRDFRLDALRALAIIFILACHFLSKFNNEFAKIGHDLMAPIGNCLFFSLSGLLLGLKWRSEGEPKYGWKFLRHRFASIFMAYELFVIPYMVILCCRGYEVPLKSWVMNVVGLSWFARLPGAGHLWFITAILSFYGFVLILSRLAAVKAFRIKSALRVIMPLSLVVAGFSIWVLRVMNFHNSWFVIFLWVASVLFLRGGGVSFAR